MCSTLAMAHSATTRFSLRRTTRIGGGGRLAGGAVQGDSSPERLAVLRRTAGFASRAAAPSGIARMPPRARRPILRAEGGVLGVDNPRLLLVDSGTGAHRRTVCLLWRDGRAHLGTQPLPATDERADQPRHGLASASRRGVSARPEHGAKGTGVALSADGGGQWHPPRSLRGGSFPGSVALLADLIHAAATRSPPYRSASRSSFAPSTRRETRRPRGRARDLRLRLRRSLRDDPGG